MITVLIVDANARLGHVMGQLLDDDHRFRLLDVVDSVTAALRMAKLHQPDVVLVSAQIDGSRGDALCVALRSTTPGSALLLWSHDAPATAQEGPDADGVLERGMTYRELARAIRDAHRRERARVVDLTDARGTRTALTPGS